MVLYEDGSLYDQDREFNVHEDIVVLPYSSGTTGPPKGKLLSLSRYIKESIKCRFIYILFRSHKKFS